MLGTRQIIATNPNSLLKYWEIIADSVKATGWTVGWANSITPRGTMFTVNAHRGDGKRYIVSADETLTAFVELEAACLKATPQN